MPSIFDLHAAYCHTTGIQLHLDMLRERNWFDLVQRVPDLNPSDLARFIGWLKVQIRDQRRNPGCLKFRNLIAMADAFEEDYRQWQALNRRPKPMPRPQAEALAATGRALSAEQGAGNKERTPAQVVDFKALIAQMKSAANGHEEKR